MSDTWDGEDRAIARALDAASDAETRGADDHLVDEYREVLAHMSVPDVTLPPELEDRVMAAALQRRPATVPTLDRARSRRRLGFRAVALATATVAAAIAVGLIVHNDQTGSTVSRGHVTLATLQRADVDALLRAPGTRTGNFGPGGGRVAIAADGNGAIYDLANAEATSIGLVSGSNTVVIGPASPVRGAIGFVVDHPDRVDAVTLLRNGATIATTPLTPR